MIYAFDPGHTTGWALADMEGNLKDMGQVLYEDIHSFLAGIETHWHTFVVENFRIRPGVNFSWSEMDTIKIIGAIEQRAYETEAKLVLQEPINYRTGAKWAGVTIPKNHSISHQVVAWAHLTYYSVNVLKNPLPAFKNRVVDLTHEEQDNG